MQKANLARRRHLLARANLENLHYKSERSMSFERCTDITTKCFNTLHKDPDQRYSDRRKVENLLKARIRCNTNPKLIAVKVFVESQHGCDFAGACGYFSQQVSRVHGPAQLEYRQVKSRKRGIYAIDT